MRKQLQSMKHTICYTSKATNKIDETVLREILNYASHSNTENNITGILLYGLGNFLQVLEGEKEVIETLYYDKISKDKRHAEIYELINKPISSTLFSEYSSSFQVIETAEELVKTRAYLLQHNNNSTAEKVARLIQPFILLQHE